MYDNEQYKSLRDSGFQWFYMFINVGAVFAPLAAIGVRNWWVERHGFVYNSDLPKLCHEYIANGVSMPGYERFADLASTSGQGALSIKGNNANVKIKKIDSETKEVLQGVRFQVQKTDGTVLATGTTNSSRSSRV